MRENGRPNNFTCSADNAVLETRIIPFASRSVAPNLSVPSLVKAHQVDPCLLLEAVLSLSPLFSAFRSQQPVPPLKPPLQNSPSLSTTTPPPFPPFTIFVNFIASTIKSYLVRFFLSFFCSFFTRLLLPCQPSLQRCPPNCYADPALP